MMEITTLSRSEQKRQQIIVAATTLFMEKGFIHTSMDQVAKLAGVSKQTVYSHFQDKNNLFVETITAHCSSSNLRKEMYRSEQTVSQNLLRIVTSFVGLVFSPEALRVFDICVVHKEDYPELGALFFEAAPRIVLEQIEACLAELDEKKLLRVDNPQFATFQLLGMVQGDWKMRHALGVVKANDVPTQAYLEDCVARFIKAYSE